MHLVTFVFPVQVSKQREENLLAEYHRYWLQFSKGTHYLNNLYSWVCLSSGVMHLCYAGFGYHWLSCNFCCWTCKFEGCRDIYMDWWKLILKIQLGLFPFMSCQLPIKGRKIENMHHLVNNHSSFTGVAYTNKWHFNNFLVFVHIVCSAWHRAIRYD